MAWNWFVFDDLIRSSHPKKSGKIAINDTDMMITAMEFSHNKTVENYKILRSSR